MPWVPILIAVVVLIAGFLRVAYEKPSVQRIDAATAMDLKPGRVIVPAKRNPWPHGEPPVRLQGV